MWNGNHPIVVVSVTYNLEMTFYYKVRHANVDCSGDWATPWRLVIEKNEG
ncbi:hypothetical protein ACIQ7N_07240 [Lysinibacillus sp. NPDC095746]